MKVGLNDLKEGDYIKVRVVEKMAADTWHYGMVVSIYSNYGIRE